MKKKKNIRIKSQMNLVYIVPVHCTLYNVNQVLKSFHSIEIENGCKTKALTLWCVCVCVSGKVSFCKIYLSIRESMCLVLRVFRIFWMDGCLVLGSIFWLPEIFD